MIAVGARFAKDGLSAADYPKGLFVLLTVQWPSFDPSSPNRSKRSCAVPLSVGDVCIVVQRLFGRCRDDSEGPLTKVDGDPGVEQWSLSDRQSVAQSCCCSLWS